MPSHIFRATLLTAALSGLATAVGAQGFISPGIQAVSPPGGSVTPVPGPTLPLFPNPPAPQPLPSLRVPAAGEAQEPGNPA